MPTPISDHTVPWPDAAVADYVAKGYWAGVPLDALLRDVADRRSDSPALVDPSAGLRLTHRELVDRADAAAARLLDLGMTRGDRIVVQLGNGWEFVVLILACLRVGIVPVTALPAHRRTELAYLARHAEATAIAVPDRLRDFDHQTLAHDLADEVREATGGSWHVLVAGDDVAPASIDLRALCAPGPGLDRRSTAPGSRDVAVFLLSGGTTGLPKLIARTHDDYAYNARRSAAMAGIDADTVYLVSLPAGHNFPLACPGILGTLLAGGTVVMLASPEPARAFATIAAEGVTHTAVVPAVAGRWLDHAAEHGAGDLASLRVLQVGGARLADELARKVAPGARVHAAAGVRDGRGTAELHPPRRPRRRRLHHPGPPDVPGRRGPPRRRARPGRPRRRAGLAAHPRPLHPARLLPGRRAERPRLHRRRLVPHRRHLPPHPGGQPDRRGPGQGHDQPRRREDLRRGGREPRLPAARRRPGGRRGDARPAAGRTRLRLRRAPAAAHRSPSRRSAASMDASGVARFKLPEHLVLVEELASTKVGKIDKKALRADIADRLAAERAGAPA